MSTFCENLKALRGNQSQAAFAKSVGLKQQRYANYESGLREPDLTTLRGICIGAGVSADWLLGLPERPNGAVTVNAPVSGAAVAVGNATATVGGDCAKCQLMIEHIRQITGRG